MPREIGALTTLSSNGKYRPAERILLPPARASPHNLAASRHLVSSPLWRRRRAMSRAVEKACRASSFVVVIDCQQALALRFRTGGGCLIDPGVDQSRRRGDTRSDRA